MARRLALVLGLLAGLLPAAAGACGTVAATLLPLAWMTEEIGGERVEAFALVPPGASPHAFEPRPSDVARVETACLFVSAGDGSDAWAERLAASRGPERRVVLSRGPGARTHAWLDPLAVRDELAPRLTEALVARDSLHRSAYADGLTAFQKRLTALDRALRADLSGAGTRYVAAHDGWGAFAARYGLEAVGVLRHADGGEAGPRTLAHVVREARAAGVRAVLVEPGLPPRLARAIAAELEAGTELVDPLGDPADPARASYEALLRFNAAAFRRALGEPR